jgi:ketosteroid isomerase-like protein
MTDEDAVLELEAKRIRAMNEADPDAMLSLLQDDHVHVMANGVVADKKGAAEGVRNIPRTVEPGQLKVRVYGDIAIVTGPQTNHERINGQPVTLQLFVTRVARRTDGVWRFVSMQATRLPA